MRSAHALDQDFTSSCRGETDQELVLYLHDLHDEERERDLLERTRESSQTRTEMLSLAMPPARRQTPSMPFNSTRGP